MFGRLLKGSTAATNVKRVIGDGAYNSRDNFLQAIKMDVDALIRVRKNASVKLRGCMPRRLADVEQLTNEGWRRERVMGIVGWLSLRFRV